MLKRIGYIIVVTLGIALSGCANYGVQNIRKQEKAQAREVRNDKKILKEQKKHHYKIQTKETQERMKASEKRFKKHQKHKNKRGFWDFIFG